MLPADEPLQLPVFDGTCLPGLAART